MNGSKNDIDPASELLEEDEEQALPEPEQDLDLAAVGPLAVGRAVIASHAKLAPSSPGVYRMIDAKGDVLYVGKAKNIRKRIIAYGRPTGYDPRIERMIAATAALEFVSTATETEALLLEANLIKRLRPRFNVLLRDDKSFPHILITADHWAPQILKHRGARTREGNYYGPFASVWAVNRTITALQRAFLLRSCSDGFFESRTRPCLLYQIKRCSGPCTREIDFAEYGELVREANAFLSGKSQAVKDELAAEMEKASAALDFERAAIYRDRLAALSAVQSHQGINPHGVEEADVFALHQAGGFSCVEVFFFRTGQNWGNRAYFPKADRSLSAGEVLGAFLAQFYDDKPSPRAIFISHEIEERALLAEALSIKSGRKVEVSVPPRGEKKDLVDHALANAREALARKLAESSSQRRLLELLAEVFVLARPPRRIEARRLPLAGHRPRAAHIPAFRGNRREIAVFDAQRQPLVADAHPLRLDGEGAGPPLRLDPHALPATAHRVVGPEERGVEHRTAAQSRKAFRDVAAGESDPQLELARRRLRVAEGLDANAAGERLPAGDPRRVVGARVAAVVLEDAELVPEDSVRDPAVHLDPDVAPRSQIRSRQ